MHILITSAMSGGYRATLYTLDHDNECEYRLLIEHTPSGVRRAWDLGSNEHVARIYFHRMATRTRELVAA